MKFYVFSCPTFEILLMFALLKKTVLRVIIILLLVTNVLTLTNSKVHDALYSMLSALKIPQFTLNSPTSEKLKLKKQIASHKKAITQTKRFTKKLSKRITRNAKINIASMPFESIPLIGIATIVSVTAMDINDACETMKDLDELSILIDDEGVTTNRKKVCGTKVPTKQELITTLEQHYDGFNDALGGTLYNIFN